MIVKDSGAAPANGSPVFLLMVTLKSALSSKVARVLQQR